MIKNFNFYDIYGYFLPGLVLLTLFGLPFLIAEPRWPAAELGSAIAFLALAYIGGHILQMLTAAAIPSFRISRLPSGTVLRFPSDRFLDNDDDTFSQEFKLELSAKIKKFFGVDVSTKTSINECSAQELATICKRRQEAFFLCRSSLVSKKINTYGEQFEGMYTLMRGLTAAFAFATFYFFGWALSTQFPDFEKNAILVAGIMLLLAVISSVGAIMPPEMSEKLKMAAHITLITLLIATLAVGSLVAFRHGKVAEISGVLWVLTLCSFLATIRSYGAFRGFTREFAKAVYRDFYVYEGGPDVPKESRNPDDD